MIRIVVATRSAHKLRELQQLLGSIEGIELIDLDGAGIERSADEETIEIHDSFEANALAKARYYSARTPHPVLADDSGLSVDALGGEPGVRSKRFSGRTELSGDELDAAAGVIPHVKGECAVGAGDPLHLAQRLLPVRHEVEDQGRGDHVDAVVGDRQRLRVPLLKAHPRVCHRRSSSGQEALRGVKGQDALRPALCQNRSRQRAGAAAHFQPVQSLRRIKPGQKARRYPAAPPPHVEVVAVAALPSIVAGCIRHGEPPAREVDRQHSTRFDGPPEMSKRERILSREEFR